mgnify:CR=1 FL=1
MFICLFTFFQVLAAHGCGRLFQHKWIVLHQLCLSAQTLWKLWQTIKTWALQHLKKNLWKCVRKFFFNFLRENPDPTQKIRKPKKSGSCRILLISGSRPLKTIQFLSSGLKYFRVVTNYSVASQALDQRSGRVLKIFGFL